MPRLKLDQNSSLYTRIPQYPMFVEDEIEIWLYSSGKKFCLFRDSLHYVLRVEGSWVVQYITSGSFKTGKELSEIFLNNCFGKNSDKSYVNYLFLEYANYHNNVTWLSRSDNDANIMLEVWKFDAFATPYICEKRCAFSIPYADFIEWWNQVLLLDQIPDFENEN